VTVLFSTLAFLRKRGLTKNHTAPSLGVPNPREMFTLLIDLILAYKDKGGFLLRTFCLDLGIPTQEGGSRRTILFPILVFLTQGRGSLTDLVLAV